VKSRKLWRLSQSRNLPINQLERVISIKKYLTSGNEAERALTHVVRVLVQGIADHAAARDIGESEEFRESTTKAHDAMMEASTPEELLVHAGSIVKAFEEHSRRSARERELRSSELQHIVRMLTSTLASVAASANANIGYLSELEKRIVSSSQLDDVRMIRSKLADCLTGIRTEVERQRSDTRETIENLTKGLEQSRSYSPEMAKDSVNDAVTGLPLRPAAEAALVSGVQAGAAPYVAVMVLDRLQGLNARFGREVGDQVLRVFARTVQRALTAGDQLYRWSGPVLLALLPRQGAIERVRTEMGRIVETKVEHTIETGSRSILIPIAPRWAVFPMSAAPRLLCQRIDTFASVGSARD